MSSNQSSDCNARSARREWATDLQGLGSQREIRRAIIEADLVDCMVALSGQLFYSTHIPVCLCFLRRNKCSVGSASRTVRSQSARYIDLRKQTFFINARKMGTLIDRIHCELTDADIEEIVSTYHAWRGDGLTQSRQDAKKAKDSEFSASA